jgi:hypothetical protein
MNMSEAVLEGKRDSVDAQRLIAIVGDSDRAVYSVELTVWCRRMLGIFFSSSQDIAINITDLIR